MAWGPWGGIFSTEEFRIDDSRAILFGRMNCPVNNVQGEMKRVAPRKVRRRCIAVAARINAFGGGFE